MSDPVQPAPVPLTVACGAVKRGALTGNGPLSADAVVLQISSATGTNVFFLPHDLAKQVAALLTELTSGIVMATPSLASQLADAQMERRR